MTEFSLSTLLLSHFFRFSLFLLSHPLYFSYFIFFFPYLLKLLSFLSPLLFLLPLAFFTVFPGYGLVQDHNNSDHSEFFSVPRICQENEEFRSLEELEFYNVVFLQTCRFETGEIPDETVEVEVEMDCSSLFKLEKLVVPIQEAVESESEREKDERESAALRMEKDERESAALRMEKKIELKAENVLAMAKDVEESEEMDLLWEKYEMESMSESKKDLKSWVDQKEEEEEDEEEDGGAKICCLQALKFSTGKMRFGMGRNSSLKKISKAFKGIKLLDQLTRNEKKKKTRS